MTVTELTRRARRPLGTVALSALLVLSLVGAGSTGAPAGQAPTLLPEGALAPNEQHVRTARRIATQLEAAHYRRATIDDRMSPEIYQRYLDSLDGQRSYFLASDIAEFDQWKLQFDDMIRSGNVEPAFLMYARLQQRNRERIAHALALLSTEPNFTLNESYDFDREKAPWPASAAELDELWRKRVKSDALSLALTGKPWTENTETLRKRYERVLKRAEQVTSNEVFENLMNAYTRTFDPHSSYFSARSSEEYRIEMSLSYEGIGATLQSEDDYASIVNLLPGGPAAAAGTLGINDRIVAIAQGKEDFEEVIGWRLDDVVDLIRGKGGTMVRLQVLPAGAAPGSPEKIIELTRGKVTLEGKASKKERLKVTRNGKPVNIGVISVPAFYRDADAEASGDKEFRSTTRDVASLLAELRKEGPVDALVLDLRNDGGGFLPEAIELTGLFIDRGPVVQLKDYTGRVEVLEDRDTGAAYDGPLVVLINRYSASASEIFAGAIQDYGRGYVIGQRSFGKGTVQNLIPLDRWSNAPVDGQLTVTIGKFYRVTGESTQHRGVEPDIVLPSSIDMEEVGESALEAALPWDRIAPAGFRRIGLPARMPSALELEKVEAARAANDPDYRWLVESIAVNERLRGEQSLSLNLAARKIEREQLDADRLKRENTRRAALGKKPFANLEELEKSDEVSGEKAPDILLNRTAEIVGDLVSGLPDNGPPRTLARKPAAGTTPQVD
ncbi:MAG TPA: carboxy terminal-processing peptidase [Steroidobacteraceae bacterium]|nr:carboxy terminal-processing peptidase [Steroidobacteraceae bacterium]